MDYISICACTDVVIGRGLKGHMVIVCFGLSTIYGNLSYVYHIMLYQWDQSAMGSGWLPVHAVPVGSIGHGERMATSTCCISGINWPWGADGYKYMLYQWDQLAMESGWLQVHVVSVGSISHGERMATST